MAQRNGVRLPYADAAHLRRAYAFDGFHHFGWWIFVMNRSFHFARHIEEALVALGICEFWLW